MSEHIFWRWGAFALSETALLGLAVTGLLLALALWLRPRLRGEDAQVPPLAEAGYLMMRNAVAEVVPPEHVAGVLPFVGTLWLYVLVGNLFGLVPGLVAPTGDLSVTAALAVVVLVAVHVYGIRSAGWRAYLRHYLSPNPLLLPFHIISEITRTLALSVRLFGNMMSLEMAALLVLLVAGLLVPVPLLLLHVVEALVQAYIFGMLALIYVASALESAGPRAGDDTVSSTPESA